MNTRATDLSSEELELKKKKKKVNPELIQARHYKKDKLQK